MPRAFVPLPFYQPRYMPDTTRLAAIYGDTGRQLATLALQRGDITAEGLARLGAIYGGYVQGRRENARLAAELAERELGRAEALALRREEMAATDQARQDALEARQLAEEREAAEYLAERTSPGVITPATAALLAKWPHLRARLRVQDRLPARALAGSDLMESGQPDIVWEPTPEQARQAGQDQRAREAEARRQTEEAEDRRRWEIANVRAERESAENRAFRERQLRLSETREPKPTYEWVELPGGQVAQVEKGTAPAGSKPYATSGGGLGGAAIRLRNSRAAAALNKLDQLKRLAPERVEGPAGILQGMGQVAAGYAGYNTQARQFQAQLQPTAMLMAAAVQGAANLSDNERKAMAQMLGSIHTMDYETQMALLDQATDLLTAGYGVRRVRVRDQRTGAPVERWVPSDQPVPSLAEDVETAIPAAPAVAVGQIVTVRGQRIRVTNVYPDGTFDGEVVR